MALHINIEDLLSARTIESDRIEFKKGWNPDAIYRSICAFANDFDNTGGGYILIGVEEENGIAKRPVKGLSTAELAEIQRKMIGFNNLIQPAYHTKLIIEPVDSKEIIVLWVPGGSNRPYQVPEQITARQKRNFYYIRKYANSVKANQQEQQELIALANQVPFDDRANTQANMDNISMLLVKDYLLKVKSKLAETVGKQSDMEVLGQMELVSGPVEHVFPRNVGLIMFSDSPEQYFPCTQVEVVYFPEGEAAPYTEYEPIKGPIASQIKNTLDLLQSNFLKEKVIKPTDKAESIRIWNYPFQVIEETLVNAFYHREYQVREPIEIRVYSNSMVFINHGGPDRSINMQAFQTGKIRPRRYRNRRLGDFLKELELTEGRATGIPTILKVLQDNGSPAPHFNTDDDRTFFEVELFIHPAFEQKPLIILDLDKVTWNLKGIDDLLDEILIGAGLSEVGGRDGDIAGGIADSQAGTIASDTQSADIQSNEIVGRVNSNQAGTIAGGIAGGIADKLIWVLKMAKEADSRKNLLAGLALVNNANNFETYIQPLVVTDWLTMTIPDKPTSPKQQYLTTLKGKLILGFLKYKTK